MKFCKLILFPFFFAFPCIAQQNLVPNPSFEDYTTCPSDYCQVQRAIGWLPWGYSPDYFNACYPFSNLSVPYNSNGYQYAATGDAYCGIGTYSSSYNNVREYIGTELLFPLVPNKIYSVSFKISLADNTTFATNKIGILFTTTSYAIDTACTNLFLTLLPPPNYAHLYTDSVIIDKLNWTIISGSFIADSAYSHMAIGNFFDDNNTDTIRNNTNCCLGYYYIDDVSVMEDTSSDTTRINESYSKNIFYFLPNPTSGKFTISIKDPLQSMDSGKIKIYNVIGDIIFESAIHNIEIDLSNQPRGIYSVEIITREKTFNEKLIIQ